MAYCSRYVSNNLGDDPESPKDAKMSPPLVNTEAKPFNNSVQPRRRIAVSANNVWKQYGTGKGATPVLQNLNMTVPEGTM